MKLREMVGAMVVYLLIAARQITAQSCEGTKPFFNDCESKTKHIYTGTEYYTTKNGLTCQNWSTQTKYPEYAYLGNHNFCRNPDDHWSSWCVPTDPSKAYEECDVPLCDWSDKIRSNNERLAACKKNPKCEGCLDLLRKWEHTNCESTKFLTIKERLWRDDGRCGESYPLRNGHPGQCNPNAGYPCCSKHGWCGRTVAHCQCSSCINYADLPEYPITPMIDLDANSLGEWGPLEQCKYPHFVHKMELKIEPDQGSPGDDTALNAIRLICSDGQAISSTQQRWGDWKGVKECDVGSFINAAKIRRESSQGGEDDTGGNGIRFKCTDGNEHHPGDGYRGDWSSYQSCKPGSAVYGIQTRVATAGGDNTALNDVRFLCAKLPLEEEDSCVTSQGACIFPFTFDGHTYNGCTNYNHDKAWCATKENQTGSWWDNCPSTCQMHLSDITVYTACVKNPKCEGCEHTINILKPSVCELTTPIEEENSCVTSEGACIFPFTFDGHTYNGCTNASNGKAWCATKEDQTGKWWGNCPSTCQMHLSEEEDSCVTEEGACIFPFTFDGHTYYGCTNASNDKAWCATKEDQTGSWWGNCPSTCQMHLSGFSISGGPSTKEGNIFYNGAPICDDHWDNTNARVFCRMLGFQSGRATQKSKYGQVSSHFAMDEVRCNGNETSLLDCPHLTQEDCGSHEGAGVVCSDDCESKTKPIYTGTEYNTTKNGLTCQNWSTQTKYPQYAYIGNHNFCRNPDDHSSSWCVPTDSSKDYEDCDVPICDEDVLLRKRKDLYRNCVTKLRCDGCKDIIKSYLPELIRANLITEGEIGVHDGLPEYKRTCANSLGMLKEGNILTRRVFDHSVTINGTVNGYIGKRNYGVSYMRYRPTGLYAAPGDMVTVTFPEKLSGKVGVYVGLWEVRVYFPPMNPSVFKIGSPWGGHIMLWLAEKDAIKGEFTIKVDNAIKAPFFVLGKTTNEEWNSEIRHYSPKWAVFMIPGQANIFIQTLRIKDITDMEGALNRIKKTMDVAEDMIGLPAGSQPGAQWIFFNCNYNYFRLGWHLGGRCYPGASMVRDVAYSNNYEYTNVLKKKLWKEEGNGTERIILHEMGHSYCNRKGHDSLPKIGYQWTAETTRRYIEYMRGDRSYEYFMTNPDLDFYLFYRMVAFSLFSNGRPCGEAKFNSRQLFDDDYDNCWKWLNWIPERLHGWHIWRDVLTLDAKSTKNYISGTDRMVDLYCQATKYNMLPLFNLYNIQPEDQTITSNCENLPESDLLTKWLNIIICVKESMTNGNQDMRDCAKMPHFPKHKGVCLLNGVCQNDKTYGGVTTNMKNRFDLYEKMKYEKNTANNEEKCLKRSSDYFKDCENDDSQYITATFITKDGNSKSRSLPPLGRATMSSIYSESYSAEKCMDYNLDTYCHNKNEDEENPFFMIEYPAPVKVNEVRLTTTDETDYWDNAREIVVIVTNDTIPEMYSEPIKGCIWHHNMKKHHGKNLEECKEKCSLETSCNSLEYREQGNLCYLSKETKDTQPNSFYEPCTGEYADMDYIEKTETGVQIGPTFEGPATKGREEINFRSETGVIGKYVIVQQQYKGIMTFAEVEVNLETGGMELNSF